MKLAARRRLRGAGGIGGRREAPRLISSQVLGISHHLSGSGAVDGGVGRRAVSHGSGGLRRPQVAAQAARRGERRGEWRGLDWHKTLFADELRVGAKARSSPQQVVPFFGEGPHSPRDVGEGLLQCSSRTGSVHAPAAARG